MHQAKTTLSLHLTSDITFSNMLPATPYFSLTNSSGHGDSAAAVLMLMFNCSIISRNIPLVVDVYLTSVSVMYVCVCVSQYLVQYKGAVSVCTSAVYILLCMSFFVSQKNHINNPTEYKFE